MLDLGRRRLLHHWLPHFKARICSSQRYRVQKHSALWQIGKFSEYKSGVVKGNTIVCELCVESEDYLHCEITLGKDFSTTPLKNHFLSCHKALHESFISKTRAFNDEASPTVTDSNNASLITSYLPAENSHLYYIAKMVV